MDLFKQTTDQQLRDCGIVTEIRVRNVTRLLYSYETRPFQAKAGQSCCPNQSEAWNGKVFN